MTARIKKALPKKYVKSNNKYSDIKSHLLYPKQAKGKLENDNKAFVCGNKNKNDNGYCKVAVELCAANSTKVSPYFKEQKKDDKNKHTCKLIDYNQPPKNVPPTRNADQPHNVYLNNNQIEITIPRDPFNQKDDSSGTQDNKTNIPQHTQPNLPPKDHNVGDTNKTIIRHHHIKDLREIVDFYIENDENYDLEELANNFITYDKSESSPNRIYYSTTCKMHTWYNDSSDKVIYTGYSTYSNQKKKYQYINFLISEDQLNAIKDDTNYDFENNAFYLFSVCQVRDQFKNSGFNNQFCIIDLTDQNNIEKYLYIVSPNRDTHMRFINQ